MYLRDYQILGGIFLPGPVHKATTKTALMSGELHLQDHVFYVKVAIRLHGLSKIVKVSGKTKTDALRDRKMLLEIYYDAIKNNTNGLKSLVKQRTVKKIVYVLIFLCNLFCFVTGTFKCLFIGFIGIPAVIVVLSVAVICFMLIYRHKIIGVY